MLDLILTRNINNTYVDGKTPYFTREQIGSALEYAFPNKAIGKIHERHKERLDKFSTVVSLTTVTGEKETYIYSTRGMPEICRRSKQSKAKKEEL